MMGKSVKVDFGSELSVSDFSYDLPPDLIAQHPVADRDQARMLVLPRDGDGVAHRRVCDLAEYVAPGDVLVMNDTRVFPARLFGSKAGSGGRVEVLLVERVAPDRWTAMCRASGHVRAGHVFLLANGRMRASVVETGAGGLVTLELATAGDAGQVIEEEGIVPLPPYIRRPGDAGLRQWTSDSLRSAVGGNGRDCGPEHNVLQENDRDRYQTVYASKTGAVAAPTAGLHFTRELLTALKTKGVTLTWITLHVGPGTFRPVKAERISEHVMDEERFEVAPHAADCIRTAKERGRRVIAVGTTVVRTLEHVAALHGSVVACAGRTALFVRPPYQFRVVDGLLTNFHLPRSTLLMLVSAFAGKERVLDAYRTAVAERYRFYSYGDCMLIV